MHQENKNRSKIETLIRFLVWGLAIVLLISLIRNVSRSLTADFEIKQAKQNLVEIEKENQDLKSELDIIGSDYFKEKEARDNLGFSKSYETVLVLPPADELRKLAPQREKKTEILPDPNWKKWMKLFF